MSTEPFHSDAAEFITQTHRQDFAVRATHPDWEGPLTLDAEDISLTWDESRAPRVTASLTCRIPSDLDTLNLLDPRTGVRVQIDAGYIRPGGVRDVHTIADLGLRRRTVLRPQNQIRLECAGDEALVIDASPAVAAAATGNTVPGAMLDLLAQSINPAPFAEVRTQAGAYAVVVNPVTDRWNAIDDLAQRIDADVYDAGLRSWVIEQRPVGTAATPDLSLKEGIGGTVIDSDVQLDRDGWFNYVALRYEWRDAADVEHFLDATAYVASGSYVITGPAGRRIYLEERATPTTQGEANAAAASVLGIKASRSNVYRLNSLAAYWLRPGMTVRLQPRLGTTEDHLVSSVTFSIPDGTMSVVTRQPETFTIATTTPPPPVPEDPPPPAEQDPTGTPMQTYVSTWIANESATYKGDGARRTDTTDVIQGYQGSNGNQQGLVLFTAANSVGGETGKTITQALTGASIQRVEVYLYANHWYYNSGGTARIGFYDGTTVPGSFGGGSPYVESGGWPKPGGRWVDITNGTFAANLLDGSARGITVGPGSSNNAAYYGRFDGANGANKPLLRITYTR